MSVRHELLEAILEPGVFDRPYPDLEAKQLEAAHGLFAERKGQIGLLRRRADDASIREITSFGDLVPLLDDNDQPNKALAGKICADQIVPYPPGIPVLVPGQLITDNIIEYLLRYLRVQSKVELHGVVYQGYSPSIRVLTAGEESRLASLLPPRVTRKAA